MITDRIDPTGLATIPGAVNLTIATGSRIIHVSGQTGVDADGKVVGSTHLDQSRRALQNLSVAIDVGRSSALTTNLTLASGSWNSRRS